MVFLIPAVGLLLWIGVLLVAMILCGIVWAVCGVMLALSALTRGITGTKPRPGALPKAAVGSRTSCPREPERSAAAVHYEAEADSDIWPKWNASHRRYMARELSLWQEQFDALNSLN
jgi:hypothetical protein